MGQRWPKLTQPGGPRWLWKLDCGDACLDTFLVPGRQAEVAGRLPRPPPSPAVVGSAKTPRDVVRRGLPKAASLATCRARVKERC